jgi:serine/threonine protein kinase
MARAKAVKRAPAPSLNLTKRAGAEPIPGYRLIEPLGTGGFGEVWKCEAPGGLLKAIKFVYGSLNALHQCNAPAEEELRAIQHVKAIRHPFLLSMERVENIDGELVIVLELADKSLFDLLNEYRAAGQSGVPRDDVLAYLWETAEALDVMNLQHGLQHLDIKPRNLFLVCNHVKVGDFGLVNSLGWADGKQQASPHLGAITPLYASPEILQGTISRNSDQYSLALVYHELLTGSLPFNGKNARQLLLQRVQNEPDLHLLPTSDWPAVARALAKNPEERFASCSDFVRALLAGSSAVGAVGRGPKGEKPAIPAGHPPLLEKETELLGGEEEKSNETVSLAAPKTDPVIAPPAAEPPCEVVAGHRLLQCLGRTPLTEIWKAEAEDGRPQLVKILYGVASRQGRQDEKAIARLQALRHPVLVPFTILHSAPGRLVIACDLITTTLRDRLVECQAEGLPGIPRLELLDYLRSAAEGLHSVYQQHGIQHLGLNPRNLLLDWGRLVIADHGLVQLLWLPAGQPPHTLNKRYAAPELLQAQVHANSDQYSLALIYHEMLTGTHLRHDRSGPPTSTGRPGSALSLDNTPVADRAVLARALHPVPEKRWPSCLDLVQALEMGTGKHAPDEKRLSGAATAVLRRGPSPAAETISAGPGAAKEADGPTILDGDLLQTKLSSTLPAGVIRHRLDGFRLQWNGQVIRAEDSDFVFQMKTPRSVWQRWLGRTPGVEVHIHLTTAERRAATEVAVQIKPQSSGGQQSVEMLQVVGPVLLESLRTYFQVDPKRRAHERFVWQHPLRAWSVFPDGSVGEPIDCQGKDISLNGIGFYVAQELPTSQVRLELPQTPQTPRMTVPVRIVRVQNCGNGRYEVGGILLPPSERSDKKGSDPLLEGV